jgi:hypothetical protein
VERFHAFRLVVQHLVGARDLALTRLGARRSLGAIGGAARRLLRGGLRRASGFFVLAASLFDVVGRVGSEVGTSARFVRRVRRDADFLFFFRERALRRLVSSRPKWDRRVRRDEGGGAIAYLERVRPPGRAGIAQSLEVRAVVVARFRGDGRVAKLRVDGAWFGQGGMTKAETDARWLTGRARAANALGGRVPAPACARARSTTK